MQELEKHLLSLESIHTEGDHIVMTYLANTDEEKVHKSEEKDERKNLEINETVDNDQSDKENRKFANYPESDESIIEEFEKIPKQ
jgi:hypothetical protein